MLRLVLTPQHSPSKSKLQHFQNMLTKFDLVKGFCYISYLIWCRNFAEKHLPHLHLFSYKMILHIYVLCLGMVDGVVWRIDTPLIVFMNGGGSMLEMPQLN